MNVPVFGLELHSGAQRRLNRRSLRGGFTLVEVMVTAVLFVMIAVAALATVTQSYRLSIRGRYQNQAMNALKSVANQFQSTINYTYRPLGAPSATPIAAPLVEAVGSDPLDRRAEKRLWMITDTAVAGVGTGSGMDWSAELRSFIYPADPGEPGLADAADLGMLVPLGTASNRATDAEAEATVAAAGRSLQATVTREVSAIAGTTMRRGTFRATYRFPSDNADTVLTVVAVRDLSPTDFK